MKVMRLMYLEQKSDVRPDWGPAVIGLCEIIRDGQRIHYKGRRFNRCPRGGLCGGNYYEMGKNGEFLHYYWITGVKKRGSNRHPCGGGPVEIDPELKCDSLDKLIETYNNGQAYREAVSPA